MIAAPDTIVQPLTVVIESVYTDLADVAVTAARQNDHFAGGTDLSYIKLIKYIHKSD